MAESVGQTSSGSSGASEVVSMYFPDSLAGADFQFRKMTIGIYEIKSFTNIKEELIDKITQVAADVASEKYASAMDEITKKMYGKLMRSISLPIPNELADIAAHGWSADTGLAKMAADTFGVNKILNSDLANRVQNQLGMSKISVNPGYYQNYTGSGPRFFSFTYNFIPNSSKEAQNLIDIIMTIKKYTSPTAHLGSTMLLAPHVLHVEFGNPKLNKLTNIRPCVLQSIDVNYSGSGFLETTMDGMPKHIVLSISLAETRALNSNDWEI